MVHITKPKFEALELPLPSLDEQLAIAREIEAYRQVVVGCATVLHNYTPSLRIDPEWPQTELGDLAHNLDGRRIPITREARKQGPYPYYGASGIVDSVDDFIFDGDYLLLSEDGANLLARSSPVAFSVSGKIWVNNHAHILEFDDPDLRQFVEHYINGIDLSQYVTGAAQPKLTQANMNRIPIPVPPSEQRRNIVARLQREQETLAGVAELKANFEAKITARLDAVWGETSDTESPPLLKTTKDSQPQPVAA